MIGERRYGVGSRGRSPRHPPPRSRDANPPRYWKLSPNRRHGTEEYSGEANTSRRVEKRDNFDDRVSRFSAFDDRERDRFGGRRFRSPQRNEERVNFDRPVSFSSYGDGAADKYGNEINVVRPGRSYDEDSYRGDLRSMEVKRDHSLGGSRKSDRLSMVGDRDFSMQNPYLDQSQAGLPASRYLDSTKPASSKYEAAGKFHSRSYSLTRGRVNDIPVSNPSRGDGSSHISYVASQYLSTEDDKDQYNRVRDELHMERNGGLYDREDHYFEKKRSGFHFQDRYLGVEKSVESDIYKFKKKVISSRGYLKGDSNYSASSSHNDYNTVSSGILREDISCYSPSRELHVPSSSDVIQRGSGVASQPNLNHGYSEKKQNMLLVEPGGQFDDTRSRSHLYVGLPEESRVGWSNLESSRSKSTRLNNVEEGHIDQHILRTDVLKRNIDVRSHRHHMEDDGLWDQYPSFQVQSTPDKSDLGGSLHVNILGTGSTCLSHGAEGYYRHGGVKTENHHADIDGDQFSRFDNSDPLRSRGDGPTFGRLDNIPRKRFPMANMSLAEPYGSRLEDEHVRDDLLSDHVVGIRISADGNGARRVYNQVGEDDEIDLVHLSKKPRPEYENTWIVSSELGSDEPFSSSGFQPRYSMKPHRPGSRDIKKRLGPKLHVSQQSMKKHKPSIKERLGPAPPKRQAALPWLKI